MFRITFQSVYHITLCLMDLLNAAIGGSVVKSCRSQLLNGPGKRVDIAANLHVSKFPVRSGQDFVTVVST